MKKSIYFLPPFLWFLLSFILLTVPGSTLPQDKLFDTIYLDKWVHIFLFSMLVHLTYPPLKKLYALSSPIFFWMAMYAWIYGIAMEFVQKYCIPNRSFDVTDIIADGVGCFLAYFIFKRKYKKVAVA